MFLKFQKISNNLNENWLGNILRKLMPVIEPLLLKESVNFQTLSRAINCMKFRKKKSR